MTVKLDDKDFSGFPVGSTKEEFAASVDHLFNPQFLSVSYSGPVTYLGIGEQPQSDPGGHHLACPRYPVAKLMSLIPPKYIEALEQNQLIASCCRHPENHDIEAWYSSDADRDRRRPDIYIFYCTCGRRHRRFCVGGSEGSGPNVPSERRPFWEVR